jgi:hypothetical protein
VNQTTRALFVTTHTDHLVAGVVVGEAGMANGNQYLQHNTCADTHSLGLHLADMSAVARVALPLL